MLLYFFISFYISIIIFILVLGILLLQFKCILFQLVRKATFPLRVSILFELILCYFILCFPMMQHYLVSYRLYIIVYNILLL